MRKISLLAILLAALPAAAYDVNGVALGAHENEVKKRFPSIHCQELQWKSLAAERRCDDSKVAFGGAPVSETRDNIETAGKAARKIYKLLWEKGDERAVLVAQPDKRRGTLSVSRGNFDEEIYRVRERSDGFFQHRERPRRSVGA